MAVVAVSGGFDPPHFGHVRLIREAATFGEVIVILNTDAWLQKKKGYVFMPYQQRAEMMLAFKGVVSVIEARDSDGTVCENLSQLKPDFFANGGDRESYNTPEFDVCKDLGIKLLFGIGGRKIASSSELVRNANIST